MSEDLCFDGMRLESVSVAEFVCSETRTAPDLITYANQGCEGEEKDRMIAVGASWSWPVSNPNSDFRDLPYGPKPVLRMLPERLFGVRPRHLQRDKFVPLQAETRQRLIRQISSDFGIWV